MGLNLEPKVRAILAGALAFDCPPKPRLASASMELLYVCDLFCAFVSKLAYFICLRFC